MHSVLLLLCLLACAVLGAQEERSFRNQLSLTNDNDVYTLRFVDRYYTNGLLLRYTRAIPPGRQEKRLLQVEAGHHIYTPYSYEGDPNIPIDRPFTGLLYLKGSLAQVRPDGSIWQGGVQGGVSGRAAGGESFQTGYHRRFGFPEIYGWETQLPTALALDLSAGWLRPVTVTGLPPMIDIHVRAGAEAGTTFIRATAGGVVRAGRFNRAGSSVHFGTRVTTAGTPPARESFFYTEPTLTLQGYNATLQGGLFAPRTDHFRSRPRRLVYSQSFGWNWAGRRWTARTGFTLRSREAVSMLTGEFYGTVSAGYHF